MDSDAEKASDESECHPMIPKGEEVLGDERKNDIPNGKPGADTEVEDDEDKASASFQYFLDLVGSKGPWNYIVFFLCAFTSFVSPLHTMSYQFLGGTPEYWCDVPELAQANWTQEHILTLAIPKDNKTGEYDGCLMHNYNYSAAADLGYEESLNRLDSLTLGKDSIKCDSRTFNLTDFQSSTVTEWDLVCSRRYLYSTTFSATFIVRLFTSPLMGYVIDTFGRRFCVLVSTGLYIPCCLLAAVAPNYDLYVILRVLISQFDACFYTAAFVLCLEVSGKSQRAMVGVLFCVPWAIGNMVLPGIAYLVRDWRYLQACLTVPTGIMLLYFWILPESPRWLILRGRCHEALKVLRVAAKWNRRPPLEDDVVLERMQEMQQIQSKDEETKASDRKPCFESVKEHVRGFFFSLWELVKSWPLFRLTAVVMFAWYSSSVTYYGVSFNAINLSANMYIYMFLGGVVELPSTLLLWPLVAFLGRKRAFIFLFVSCGISILIIPILDECAPTAPVALKMTLSLFGKMTVNMAYQLAFLYTGELYHTSQRSLVICLGGLFASVGGAIAPYINDLLVESASWAPSLIFGLSSVLAGVLSVSLPETKGVELPDNVDTVEKSASVSASSTQKQQQVAT